MRNLGKSLGAKSYRWVNVLKNNIINQGKCLGVFIVFFVVTGTSLASPKTLMVGTGDCTDEAFLQNIKQLTNIAQRKSDVDLIQLTPLFEKRKILSPKQTQEEQRILETVHSKILLGDYITALKEIEGVLDALEKSAPSAESWQLIAKALSMKGFVLSKQKKARLSEDTFVAILRLDSNYQLDQFIFPPTVVQSFERLRETLLNRKKVTLSLSSSIDGGTVFANGAPLGQTPLERELLPGAYRIVLEKEGRISIPLTISLSLGSPTHLDIPFQWDASWRTPWCIQEEDKRAVLSKQMAKELGADYLVKIETLSADSPGKGVRAALFDLRQDQIIREGGVLLEGSQQEGRLLRLVNFIVSGKIEKGENVVLPISGGVLVQPLPTKDKPTTPSPGQLIRGNTARTLSWIFIGTGSALSVGGSLMYVHSLKPSSEAKEFLKKYGNDEELTRNSRDGSFYTAAVNRKQDRQQKAIILGTAGVASLATGLILFFALPPQAGDSPQLSIAPHFGRDGGGVALMGRF